MTEKVLERSRSEIERRIPMGRIGRPGELRGVAASLASAASHYITGQTIVIDCGMTACGRRPPSVGQTMACCRLPTPHGSEAFPPFLRESVSGVRITISKENYLKAVAEAESEGESVKAVTLARWLNVSAPAVTMAIKRLKRDALIHVHAEGQITLTRAGREIATRLLNRHQLIERMLTEIFGLEWYKVHDEAEQLEHAVSADFERKLAEKLGSSGVCPHGNIVGPDSPMARRGRGLKPLEEAKVNERLAVVSVFERDRKLLEYLDSAGIRPGVQVEVLSSNESLDLSASGRTVRIERPVASAVWVKEI